MSSINLSAVDLNLLVALDALLGEASVTRAARRVGVGQSAMSHSLRRLRDLLDDPLLVRVGRRMEPTPRARSLARPLAAILADVERLLVREGPFEPARSRRSFRLVCNDLLAAFLPDLLADLGERAPGIDLEVRAPTGSVAEATLSGGHDLGLGPPQHDTPGMLQRTLGSVGWVVLARRGHPALEAPLTPERWVAWPHVIVRTGSASASIVGQAIAAAGLSRRVGLTVPGFMAAPPIVARSDLLFAAPDAVARAIVGAYSLAITRPPLDVPHVPVVAVWPERLHADPAHVWFRERVTGVVGRLLAAGPEAAR